MFGDTFGRHADYGKGIMYASRMKYLTGDVTSIGKTKRCDPCKEDAVKPPPDFMTRKQARDDLIIRKNKIGHNLYQLPYKASQTQFDREPLDHAAIIAESSLKNKKTDPNRNKLKQNQRQNERQQQKRYTNNRKSTISNQDNSNESKDESGDTLNNLVDQDKLRDIKVRMPPHTPRRRSVAQRGIVDAGSLMSEATTTVDDDDRLHERFGDGLWELCEQAGTKFWFHPITGEAKPYERYESESAEEVEDLDEGTDSFSFLDDWNG